MYTPTTLVISREGILSQNVNHIRHTLDSFASHLSEKHRNNIVILISGYDDDERDLFLIPEVRQWHNQLFKTVPELFFWMDMSEKRLLFYALMMSVPIQLQNGVTISPKDLDDFLIWGYQNLNVFCAQRGLDTVPSNKHIRGCLHQQLGTLHTAGATSSELSIHEPEVNQLSDLDYIPQESRHLFTGGKNCDQLEGSSGNFGRSPNNPIPVNGAYGSFKYLNKLFAPSGRGFFFHRISSVHSTITSVAIDMYELVALDASHWDILFLDMYHPRRSNISPTGLTLRPYSRLIGDVPLAYGINTQLRNFPYDIPEALEIRKKLPAFARRAREFLAAKDFTRPTAHLSAMQALKVNPINVTFDDPATGIQFWIDPRKHMDYWKE